MAKMHQIAFDGPWRADNAGLKVGITGGKGMKKGNGE